MLGLPKWDGADRKFNSWDYQQWILSSFYDEFFLNHLLEVERPIESIGQACLLNELLSERAWPRVNGDEPRLLDEKLAFGLAGVQESLLSGKVNQTTGWWSPLQYSPLLTPHHTTIRADLSISHKPHRHIWDLNYLCIQFCYLRSRWNENKSLSLSLSFFTYRFAVPYTRFFCRVTGWGWLISLLDELSSKQASFLFARQPIEYMSKAPRVV